MRSHRYSPQGWGTLCQPAVSSTSTVHCGCSGTSRLSCLCRVLCPFPSCPVPHPAPAVLLPQRAPSWDPQIVGTASLGRDTGARPPRHPAAPRESLTLQHEARAQTPAQRQTEDGGGSLVEAEGS